MPEYDQRKGGIVRVSTKTPNNSIFGIRLWFLLLLQNILADDDLAPVREPEADDDLIILEEVNSGESGVMVAAPSQTEVTKTKKRRQPVITDFLLKKHK